MISWEEILCNFIKEFEMTPWRLMDSFINRTTNSFYFGTLKVSSAKTQ